LISSIEYINDMRYGVNAILGDGKTFKSGTLYSILDICPKLRERPKAFWKFPNVRKLFPDYLNCYSVDYFDDIKNGSIVVIEDANRVFPSRASSRSFDIQEILGLSSHKDWLFFLTLQSGSNVDQAFFRDQDVNMIYKKKNPVAIQFERPEFQSDCVQANMVIDKYSRIYKVNPLYVSYLPRFDPSALILDSPPSWYGYAQSHALSDYVVGDSLRSKSKGEVV